MYKSLLFSLFALSSVFALEIHSIDGDWRRDAIDREIAPFRERMTYQDIETYNRAGYSYLYVIKDNQLTVSADMPEAVELIKYRNNIVVSAINTLLKTQPLPDMSFLIDVGDLLDREPHDVIPVFVFSKKKGDQYQILMPDYEMFSLDRKLWPFVLQGSSQYPWTNKRSIAFWRGSTSSGNYALPSWRDHPRSRVVLEAQKSESLVDAKFTNHCQGAENNLDFLQVMGPEADYVSVEEHLLFKYLIDVDGNATTYSRLFWILLSNSMPLKVESDCCQWYYLGLEPHVHYMPIKPDSSDLLTQVQWAINHDDEAYTVAMQSQEFAFKYLCEDAVYSYFYHLLLSYSELFSD